MPSFNRFAGILAAHLAGGLTVGAQGGAGAGTAPRAEAIRTPSAPALERMEVMDPDKKLSAGDQVTLEIIEDRDGQLPRMVTATGDIDVPPLGRVKVAGKTTGEASADIKRRLETDYYYKATVRLSLDRVSPVVVKAGTVYLAGEVRMVGPLDVVSGEPLTVSNAILKAGGFKEFADDRKVQVTRQAKGASENHIIDVKKILKSGDVRTDMVLQDGDRIFVPRVGIRF